MTANQCKVAGSCIARSRGKWQHRGERQGGQSSERLLASMAESALAFRSDSFMTICICFRCCCRRFSYYYKISSACDSPFVTVVPAYARTRYKNEPRKNNKSSMTPRLVIAQRVAVLVLRVWWLKAEQMEVL